MNKNHFMYSALVIAGAALVGPALGCSGVSGASGADSEGIDQDEAQPGDQDEDAEQVGEAESALSTWHSTYVYPNAQGKLVYATDAEGNRIPDFSYVGYNYGGSLPSVATKKTLSPQGGDDTLRIQQAVDDVGKLPKNANGIRGAVLLKKGTYTTSSPIYVSNDGVVIRGEGSGTIVKSTRSGKDVAVFVMGSKQSDTEWKDEVPNSKVAITSASVPIGQRKFQVASAAGLKVGDLVVVAHVPKSAWFAAIDDGGTQSDPGWSELGDGFTIRYVRTIKAISGKEITVDAPFYVNMKSSLATLEMFKYNSAASGAGVHYKLGIENMSIDIETNGGVDEDHTQSAVSFQGVIDGWARGLTMRHFNESGVVIWRSSRITVQDSFAGSPVSQIVGGRRYNFSVERGGQQVLLRNNTASEGRHGFVANGRVSASGIVVQHSKLELNIACSEGHLHWTTGILFDSSEVKSHAPGSGSGGFCFRNQGSSGTSHGWGAANSVMWNIKAVAGTTNVVQKPPSAQNYAIGVDGATGVGTYDEPPGAIEGTGKGAALEPSSLYAAQLQDRL